ncbi:MAG: asparagine synthase (glutamine-hydrolyzing) [Nitrospirae bacterium]|nr:asparagine synthase (glutamine-hydrolyzing) [Nitrospirota bacterium]
MCGISGFIDFSHQIKAVDYAGIIMRMSDAVIHRGPDDSGVWIDIEAGIAIGHRRLSIIDLSDAGRQPMKSQSGRHIITFNGEIYNYQEIRRELGHHTKWQGHSDTEVVLSAIERWGIEEAVKKFTGMFAFALWDRDTKTLHIVRDRFGEKPLYYGWAGNCFLFASELKSLRLHPAWINEIDRDAVSLYLRYNYIPAPYSIYKNIRKLLPATILRIQVSNLRPGRFNAPIAYWSVIDTACDGVSNPFTGSEYEATQHLETILTKSIRQQMIADVPLGAFLSGGVDSSTIVALMQKQSSRPVKTFTIGFHEMPYNEAHYAKSVAQHLGTDHTELYLGHTDVFNVIAKLPYLYDEPFSDSSQIPSYLISLLAKRYVSVSLSGDGGDELFGGYNRYFMVRRIWNKICRLPFWLRSTLARLLTIPSPTMFKHARVYDNLYKLSEVMASKDPDDVYLRLVSHWKQPETVAIGAKEPSTILNDHKQCRRISDFTQRMMFCDQMMYLPDDILVKIDRAAMGVSLETRVPFLDHRLAEFTWKLPLSMKIRNGQSKWLLRQMLYKYVPKKLIERPKMGFGVPVDSWLRGHLREWTENLLDEKRLREEGFFSPAPIRRKWTEHLSCKKNWQYLIWNVLMFQLWLDTQRKT